MSGCSIVYLDRGDRLEDRRQPAADPRPCFCRLISAERLLWKLSRIAMVHQRFCGEQSSGTFHRQEVKQNLVHVSECITTSGLQVLGVLSAEREAISTAGQLPLPGPKANHRYQNDRWMNCLLLSCPYAGWYSHLLMEQEHPDIWTQPSMTSPQHFGRLSSILLFIGGFHRIF